MCMYDVCVYVNVCGRCVARMRAKCISREFLSTLYVRACVRAFVRFVRAGGRTDGRAVLPSFVRSVGRTTHTTSRVTFRRARR